MATRAKAKAPARKPAAKAKIGRPTKWRPEYLEQVRKLCLLGLTDEEIAAVWGIAVCTFHEWKKTIDGFAAAIAAGKQVADSDIAASLYERARGYSHPDTVITSYQGAITKTRVTKHYPPDTQAADIWLRNRQPSRWRKQPDEAGSDAPPPTKVVIEVRDASVPEPD